MFGPSCALAESYRSRTRLRSHPGAATTGRRIENQERIGIGRSRPRCSNSELGRNLPQVHSSRHRIYRHPQWSGLCRQATTCLSVGCPEGSVQRVHRSYTSATSLDLPAGNQVSVPLADRCLARDDRNPTGSTRVCAAARSCRSTRSRLRFRQYIPELSRTAPESSWLCGRLGTAPARTDSSPGIPAPCSFRPEGWYERNRISTRQAKAAARLYKISWSGQPRAVKNITSSHCRLA